MKELKKISWLMMVVICLSSCNLFYRDCIPEIDSYMIALCFQDALGNNVSEGIGTEEPGIEASGKSSNEGTVDPDLYSLEVVLQNYIDGETKPGPDAYPQINSLGTIKHDKLGTCLINYFSRFRENNNVRKLTYKLKCPYIFGDKETHEIVTYWELSENIYAKCYLIEFEGQEIIPQTFENQYFSLGVIKLDYAHEN